MNLIENAIKYSKANAQIDIKMRNDECNVIVEIKDYGKGMTKDECEKIFDRFYQSDKTHSERGVGLRTSYCKKNSRIIKRKNRSKK